jgi:excinuclease ABC subunit A
VVLGQSELRIVGAQEHNLQDVTVTLPRDRLIVLTGVSGSGKSSLAFDTICKEGQRRFLESLSAYARQFLGQVEKPRVERVEGLSPTVSIDQKTVNRNPRSTVGTITEVYDHLRLLYARLGTPHCPKCRRPVASQTADQIAEALLQEGAGRKVLVLAPLVQDRKGEYRKELDQLRARGFVRARIDGAVRRLDEEVRLDRYKRHSIEVILDRIIPEPGKRSRLVEAVEAGLREGKGVVMALVEERLLTFSSARSCPDCRVNLPELEPRLFSFNSPHGACPRCNGLGTIWGADANCLFRDPDQPLQEGVLQAIAATRLFQSRKVGLRELVASVTGAGFDPKASWKALGRKRQRELLEGDGGTAVAEAPRWWDRPLREGFPGVISLLRQAALWAPGDPVLDGCLGEMPCDACDGTRLKPESLQVLFRERTIADVAALSVQEALAFVHGLELDPRETLIGKELLKEVRERLRFLVEVGLPYLTLDRSAATLSGGEAQRIRLATQVGSGLRGVLYVLDEPSIGLHPRDHRKLLGALQRLRDLGNTVLVVEHDQETMVESDHLVEIGPGAGREGGRVVAEGPLPDVLRASDGWTARYLRGDRRIAVPAQRRPRRAGQALRLVGCAEHNLRDLDIEVPLGLFVAVTGVSGSGKSTLVHDILKRALAARLQGGRERAGKHRKIEGLELVDKVVEIDQSPIGRTPRSNPATYTGVFGLIRDLFAQVPEARARGYQPGRFSFNVRGGRCEACGGAGVKEIEMQFLASVEVPCEECGGRRFHRETLEILYKGRSISEVLDLTVDEALEFFAPIPRIRRVLETLRDVGLGYIALGQPCTTISGGEAQRVKLASELHRPATGRTVYLLDEPTTGLHFYDVEKLLSALGRLVDAGNTVVVIEHNLEVVKVADHLIDLGPEGGPDGGRLVASGTPEEVAAAAESHTGAALREYFAEERPPAWRPQPPPARAAGAEGVLRIVGATKNNLKSVSVDLPLERLVVITGVSGSGKTSLAFDTIFSEGQRRFVESLSTYARRFLGRLEKAPAERIEGLGPAIAIDQKAASRNPRSTVATTTEIYDYLRLLYARAGRPHCPSCGRALKAWTPGKAARAVLAEHPGAKARVLAPLFLPGVDKDFTLLEPAGLERYRKTLVQEGFSRVLVGGREAELSARVELPRGEHPAIHVVVDRVQLKAGVERRLIDSFETAFRKGCGIAAVAVEGAGTVFFPQIPGCVECNYYQEEELTPRMFSFNSHVGACPECDGLGTRSACDPALLVPRPDRPVFKALADPPGRFLARRGIWHGEMIRLLCQKRGIPVQTPWEELPSSLAGQILHGSQGDGEKWPGLVRLCEEWRAKPDGGEWHEALGALLRTTRCPTCDGDRLQRPMLAVTVGGKNIAAACRLTVREALDFFSGLRLTKTEATIAQQVLQEVRNRLRFLDDVGLDYLSLDRSAATLSGGEAQRIRLATQIGNRLVGVLYVLDEPTIGLHPRDTGRLLKTLQDLRDLGNTIILVEHDEQVIRSADHVIDLGPGAGHRGGEVVASGPLADVLASDRSVTARYLSGRERIPLPPARRAGAGPPLRLEGARANNLKRVDVGFPRGALSVVSGVSGSGKSSLVMETLLPAVEAALDGARPAGADRTWERLDGLQGIARVVVVDQSPIGFSPASNPATYTGVFDHVRALFSELPESRARGYTPGRFSFNVSGGRCEACQGKGSLLVEMHFLSDVWITCEACGGRRYAAETLQVTWRGKSIADVLDLEVSEAVALFSGFPRIREPLQTLADVGLGYMKLGQSATTLSGGEAQRVKLAAELGRPGSGDVLYLMDEPTTGLHFADVHRLLEVFHRLADRGNTLVVIEHNVEVLRAADWIVDLGPEGGDAGGRLVAAGTPEEVAAHAGSHTGRALAALREPLVAAAAGGAA